MWSQPAPFLTKKNGWDETRHFIFSLIALFFLQLLHLPFIYPTTCASFIFTRTVCCCSSCISSFGACCSLVRFDAWFRRIQTFGSNSSCFPLLTLVSFNAWFRRQLLSAFDACWFRRLVPTLSTIGRFLLLLLPPDARNSSIPPLHYVVILFL